MAKSLQVKRKSESNRIRVIGTLRKTWIHPRTKTSIICHTALIYPTIRQNRKISRPLIPFVFGWKKLLWGFSVNRIKFCDPFESEWRISLRRKFVVHKLMVGGFTRYKSSKQPAHRTRFSDSPASVDSVCNYNSNRNWMKFGRFFEDPCKLMPCIDTNENSIDKVNKEINIMCYYNFRE